MAVTDALVRDHIAYAEKIAAKSRRSLPSRFDMDELVSAAYMGLVEAASRYEPSKGVAFTTYAYPRIYGAIIDYVRENRVKAMNLDEETPLEELAMARPESNVEELFEDLTYDLDRRGADILRLYYVEDLEMKDVGVQHGLTESRVSQIISKCRAHMAERAA